MTSRVTTSLDKILWGRSASHCEQRNESGTSESPASQKESKKSNRQIYSMRRREVGKTNSRELAPYAMTQTSKSNFQKAELLSIQIRRETKPTPRAREDHIREDTHPHEPGRKRADTTTYAGDPERENEISSKQTFQDAPTIRPTVQLNKNIVKRTYGTRYGGPAKSIKKTSTRRKRRGKGKSNTRATKKRQRNTRIQNAQLPRRKVKRLICTDTDFTTTLVGGVKPSGGSLPNDRMRAEAQLVGNILGTGTKWVGGHMVNQDLGGPGDRTNIIPISKKMNSAHVKLETAAKRIHGYRRHNITYTMTTSGHTDMEGDHVDPDTNIITPYKVEQYPTKMTQELSFHGGNAFPWNSNITSPLIAEHTYTPARPPLDAVTTTYTPNFNSQHT